MKNKINVYINLEEGGIIPLYASDGAAGCDLYATQDMAIRPGETKIMPLNFHMAIDDDCEAQIRPRSGLALKTELRVPNSPGTIDSDFRDMVGIILQNTFNIANLAWQVAENPRLLDELLRNYREVGLAEYLAMQGVQITGEALLLDVLKRKIYLDGQGNPYGTIYIKKGDRIAQMVFCRYLRANFVPHPDPGRIGKDRGGGFGHTGMI